MVMAADATIIGVDAIIAIIANPAMGDIITMAEYESIMLMKSCKCKERMMIVYGLMNK